VRSASSLCAVCDEVVVQGRGRFAVARSSRSRPRWERSRRLNLRESVGFSACDHCEDTLSSSAGADVVDNARVATWRDLVAGRGGERQLPPLAPSHSSRRPSCTASTHTETSLGHYRPAQPPHRRQLAPALPHRHLVQQVALGSPDSHGAHTVRACAQAQAVQLAADLARAAPAALASLDRRVVPRRPPSSPRREHRPQPPRTSSTDRRPLRTTATSPPLAADRRPSHPRQAHPVRRTPPQGPPRRRARRRPSRRWRRLQPGQGPPHRQPLAPPRRTRARRVRRVPQGHEREPRARERVGRRGGDGRAAGPADQRARDRDGQGRAGQRAGLRAVRRPFPSSLLPPPSPLSTRRRADGDLDTAYALLRPSSLLPPRKEPTSAPGKSTSARASCSSTPAGPSTRLVRCFSS